MVTTAPDDSTTPAASPISTVAYLFDSQGQDRQVKLDRTVVAAIGDQQLLWIDVQGEERAEVEKFTDLIHFPDSLLQVIYDSDGHLQQQHRPRLDLYGQCFHLNVQAVQDRNASGTNASDERAKVLRSDTVIDTSFRLVTVHFVVFANVVLTLHSEPAAFLESFDRRIKGDTNLGTLDGPAFLGALLNWHVTGFFRAMEALESEVNRIDDAALRLRRSREERDLLSEMVKARRRLALVRRALLPHREVYATLARPSFTPFVTAQASETLGLVYERLERAVAATETARELILGSFDIFSTQTALRTNEVVKALTLISALLLPAGVVANLAVLFIRAPVYDLGRTGFWIVTIGMAVLGAAFLVVARRRRWF